MSTTATPMTLTTLPERLQDLDPALAARLRGCMKKPIPVRALQLGEAFRVRSMEGDHKQGKPGDYLMCGVAGELYICDREIFERTYDWLPPAA